MNGKLFIGSVLAGVFALAHTSFSAEWKPVAGTMMTECGENISPDNAANLPKVSEEGIPKKQPNFIVILTDDQGWGTTSITVDPAVPESKSDFFKTPNLEKLASQGLRFTQAYSGHPNCSPSRAALLTGRSPAALHFTDICGRNSGGLYVGNEIIPPQHINALPEGELTLPEIIKQHLPAYKAAHFGKWHLGKVGPEGHGFDAGDGPTGNREGSRKDNLPDDPKRIFSVTKRANDWMAEQAKGKQPSYLQVSHYATHLGLQSRPETKQRVDKRPSGTRHQNTEFGAMIEDMDDGIGQLLAKVKELGIGDNTYILYTADNGTFPLEEPGNIRTCTDQYNNGEIVQTPAFELVSQLASGIDAAASIARSYTMERAFAIAPTAAAGLGRWVGVFSLPPHTMEFPKFPSRKNSWIQTLMNRRIPKVADQRQPPRFPPKVNCRCALVILELHLLVAPSWE